MPQKENTDITANLQLKAIEILNCTITLPNNNNQSNFNFNINLESQVDNVNKLIFVIVGVEIKSENLNQLLGSIIVSNIFNILNFDEIIKIDATGKFHIPPPLIEILNSISISTVRGVMFSTFKGTFLHNAILPIIDPRSIQVVNDDEK